MMHVEFARPEWLWIGALACVALSALMIRATHKRVAAIRAFAAASPETSVGRRRRWLRQGLALCGLAFGCIAMARPLAGYHLEQDPHRGLDLMFAVDTSKSMRAADLRPDRLTRAKLAVADLIRRFEGERIGLIAFAGDAFVQAPMTVDRGVFLESLDALDTDTIPRGGTDISSAIHAAEQALASEPDHRKVLVLLSDGEDLAGNAIEAARDAAHKGLTIYTVGVGSAHGEVIQIPGPNGTPELVRDANGQPVTSHLDEAALRAIAQVTGGAYQPLGADGRGLEALYANALSKLPRSTAAGTEHRVYTERFQIPLAFALACLVLELVIVDRRRRAFATRAGGAAIAMLFFVGFPRVAAADPADHGAVSSYNAGTSSYRGGDFTAAQQKFETALHTPDVSLQENAYYDLGNARYRAGQATLAKDRDATIASWKQSIAAYDSVLALAPGDGDAKFNRDFVARKLAELEKQQPQQQQPKPNDQKQNQQDQQKKQDNSGGGQQNQPQKQNGQGQQQKPQNGQGQQQKPQNGQGQQQKTQNGQGQSSRDQNGKGDQKPEQGKIGQGQHEPAEAAQAERDAAAEAKADEARRKAGELTHGEAVQLLDSVDGELKPMPIHGTKSAPNEQPPIRDW
jgi:Ca-activated chloride channel family protein